MKKLISKYHLKEIKIEFSYKCNLSCIHCSSEGSQDNDESISFKDALRILKSAEKMKVMLLSLSGGEPLLWPHLKSFLRECSKKECEIKIYTNGYSDDFENFFSNVKYNNLSFAFSLYGASNNIHDFITCKEGSFNNTINSIKWAVKNRFRTEIHFVPLSMSLIALLTPV